MILLDKPFVSDFLKRTIVSERLPVLRTAGLERFALEDGADIWDQEAALRRIREEGTGLFYSNSENGLGWMLEHLGFSELPAKISLFKDKVLFRDLLQPMYPEFYYSELLLEELFSLALDSLPLPMIIKPAVGFFSMGVHKISNSAEWQTMLHTIREEMLAAQPLYPRAVLDTTRFIIEAYVEGDEFAIDAFYDEQGNVVLLNILHHWFLSARDVRDRIYITSRQLIASYMEPFIKHLTEIGNLAQLRNLPIHAEVRIDEAGKIWPIEINPMRFAGWCTTDVAHYAYGINPYTNYFEQKAPDWQRILAEDDDHLYSIVVLDKPADVPAVDIHRFDYEAVRNCFEMPLELRKIDYREYPVFGFLFAKTRKVNSEELEKMLASDLKEFIN